jgi:DNA topoisomerase IA
MAQQQTLDLKRPTAKVARITRIVVVPSRAMMEQVGSALSERAKKTLPHASGFNDTTPLERYDETLLIQLSDRLYDLAPTERPKRTRAEDLPWIPPGFEAKIPEGIPWDRKALDKLVDILRAGATIIDLTEPNSTVANTLEDFLVFDADIHKVHRTKIDFDDSIREINHAIDNATERDIDANAALGRRLRAEIDYTFAVNLNAMAKERLRAARYKLDKDVDTNMSLIGTVVISSLARQNQRLAAMRTPMRWLPLVFGKYGETPLPFNVVPLPPDDITYNDALAMLDHVAGDIIIDTIEHREEIVPPPPPHTLPSLYLAVEQADPTSWTPDKLRHALASLYKKGCITNPWRTHPRYPAWSQRRIHSILERMRDMRNELSELARLPLPDARIDGDNPRIVALTPLGRPYDEAEPLPIAALNEITRRWVAHLLGPAAILVTTFRGHIGTTNVATEVRNIVEPGWYLTRNDVDVDIDFRSIDVGARISTVDKRVFPYEGKPPQAYRIGTLLDDLLEPDKLIWEEQIRKELPTGATLASPEHLLSTIERQLRAGIIRRDKHNGEIDLSEHGRALIDVFPTQLLHPAFVIAFRHTFRRAGADGDRLTVLRAFAHEQLAFMLDDMRKKVPKAKGSWHTHNRQEQR